MSKKDITIEDLSSKIDGLTNTVDDLANTVDGLARMTADGFNEVKHEITQLREQNERDHLDLKLRQDNIAYRFELQSLDKRVEQLEKKAKFA